MIDSTNPRILADNIRHLSGESGSQASDISNLQTAVITQGNSITALQIFNDDETDTGKKWIDGSSIYRKIIEVEHFPNATSATIDVDGLLNLISVYGFMPSVSGFAGRPLPYGNVVTFRFENGKMYLITTSDYSSYGGYIVIEYTKSAAPSAALSPAPDDSRSIENEDPEIRSEEIEPEVNEEVPEEEPVVETKSTTRKKSTSTK